MNLNHVAVFVRVIEAGSFTKAGLELGLPKSSTSRTVAALEETLGVQLLQRTTRKLSLTEAGKEYFDSARRVLAELNEVGDAVAKRGKEPRGIVRVTAPVDLGAVVLADIVGRFTAKYPRIHIDLSLTARRIDLVAEGIDIALRAARQLTDSSLLATKVGSAELGLFAARSYLERRGVPCRVRDLEEHACILFRGHQGGANWRLKGPHGEEDVSVKGPVNVDEMLFVSRAIEGGMGIGLLPAIGFLKGRDSPELVHVLPEYQVAGASLFVVTPAARQRTARVSLFRDFLIQSMRALAA